MIATIAHYTVHMLAEVANEFGFDVVRLERDEIELAPRNLSGTTVTVSRVGISETVLREVFNRKEADAS